MENTKTTDLKSGDLFHWSQWNIDAGDKPLTFVRFEGGNMVFSLAGIVGEYRAKTRPVIKVES